MCRITALFYKSIRGPASFLSLLPRHSLAQRALSIHVSHERNVSLTVQEVGILQVGSGICPGFCITGADLTDVFDANTDYGRFVCCIGETACGGSALPPERRRSNVG
ncbi:hypothetical protein P153DRAFT_19393 [Dothidotthia symphoricarpi CBS 119687]|uniref:Uncharacterized protein n=1 Tax=Dothidotthia symphoricarpi CBS 119687 TaxID=1392245 RepID=A0A6A6ABX2_9PLEO|nr:uncharacterized protein P153DRAFT_19393 [Dothidotthia symphoricarpi CBS 119687]KAF2129422.1 hypothetical protein P153DRAFT_19393 [Dothidotthia symphoricarpi CBS 119687]